MESVANMTLMASEGKIDDPANLVNRPAFVLIAANDETVTTNQQHAQNITQTYLRTNLESIELPIMHSIPRLGDGISNYDGIGNILRHLFYNVPGTGITELKPANEDPENGWENYGTLAQFSQLEFIEAGEGQFTGMQEFGWYFVPHECTKWRAKCNLHVAIHGCWGGARDIIIEDAGRYWGKYAATNNFVVLYPFVTNCWDTTGETGENFATKDAIQPKAIMSMIDRLILPRRWTEETEEIVY
jgi:hypothetical protein